MSLRGIEASSPRSASAAADLVEDIIMSIGLTKGKERKRQWSGGLSSRSESWGLGNRILRLILSAYYPPNQV
jgi:hypothetical protein